MPVEKRRGLVPRHGFCSLKPAREEREGMPAAAAGLYASVYGEPLSEIVSLRQEELEVPTMENPPDPPELA